MVGTLGDGDHANRTIMKTYLLKPSLEALKTSTMEMSDALKTHARKQKLQCRALALNVLR